MDQSYSTARHVWHRQRGYQAPTFGGPLRSPSADPGLRRWESPTPSRSSTSRSRRDGARMFPSFRHRWPRPPRANGIQGRRGARPPRKTSPAHLRPKRRARIQPALSISSCCRSERLSIDLLTIPIAPAGATLWASPVPPGHTVPSVGMDIPTGDRFLKPIQCLSQGRRKTTARLDPVAALSARETAFHTSPSVDWHGMFPGVSF